MSLKDDAGLVKMYALVDVVDYQKVVVSDASIGVTEAARNYLSNVTKVMTSWKSIRVLKLFYKLIIFIYK